MPELNLVEKVIALEGVDLLKNLEPEQLARIASIAREVKFAPGKTILAGSGAADSLYVILDGNVELAQNGSVLHTAVQGEVLGAWALFDTEPMPVSATASDDVHLLKITRDDFYDLLSDNMEITQSVFSTLVRRFRQIAGRL